MPVSCDKRARKALKKLVLLALFLLAIPAVACNFSSAVGLVTPTVASRLATTTTIPAAGRYRQQLTGYTAANYHLGASRYHNSRQPRKNR